MLTYLGVVGQQNFSIVESLEPFRAGTNLEELLIPFNKRHVRKELSGHE